MEHIEGALWTRDMIEAARISPAHTPWLKRIVVAIDPAASVSENSDETGIVVCGVDDSNVGYVLADASGKYLPHEWARTAIALYHQRHADRIIAEQNFGGEMVQSTIRMIDPNVSYRGVHARKGKYVRAEPVSALFEQNRVKIAGAFTELEDQLCTYDGSGDSPDRLDAMVYGLSSLMVEPARPQPVFA